MRLRPPEQRRDPALPPPELLLGELPEVWGRPGDSDPRTAGRSRCAAAVRVWADRVGLSREEARARTRAGGSLMRAMLSKAPAAGREKLLADVGVRRGDIPALRQAAERWDFDLG